MIYDPAQLSLLAQWGPHGQRLAKFNWPFIMRLIIRSEKTTSGANQALQPRGELARHGQHMAKKNS